MDSRATHLNAPDAASSAQEHWSAEYDFWYKIISGEVERLRFNDGYEPVEVDLYPTGKQKGVPGPDYIGTTMIGRQKFHAVGQFSPGAGGKKILRVSILLEPGK